MIVEDLWRTRRRPGFVARTPGLLLMTATPMQVDPREVWDLLLTALGLGGLWGAADDSFVGFYEELNEGFDGADWPFVLRMVRDHLEHGGTVDPTFAESAQQRVGLVDWQTIQGLPHAQQPRAALRQLEGAAQAVLLEFARRHTPLARYMLRNTRALLREYQRRGLLGDNRVPTRAPELRWILMQPEERDLYERIEEYIVDFYKKYEAERKGLGFVMTVYRRRLTSSFYAITKSLERRLQFLRGEPDAPATAGGLTDEDLEEDDLTEDVWDELGDADRSLYREEIHYVEDFVARLRQLGADSKAEQLLVELGELFRRRQTVLVFTLYTDTMDYLRDRLREVYSRQVACFSGRGGEVWDGAGWRRVSKEEIKRMFREEEVKILLGTDALSEGLNLQTCGMMMDFNMPWNPMRVEQRIGRIDRIGQRYDEVWIRNYFYEETVEANVYLALEGRIEWFQDVVGPLQPILARVARTIRSAAMETGRARADLLAREIAAIKRDLEERQIDALGLDDAWGPDPDREPEHAPPVTQKDIERLMLGSGTLGGLFEPHRETPGAHALWLGGVRTAVTFDPALFDEHPNTLRLLTYGDDIFQRLVDEIAPPEAHDLPSWLARLEAEDPKTVAYCAAGEGGARPVETLANLEGVLAAGPVPTLTEAQVAAARADLDARAAAVRAREADVIARQHEAATASLRERGRQLLLRAAYVDLALSAHGDLLGVAPNMAGFTEDAVAALPRRGYPFAPLIRLVGSAGLEPSPTDPFSIQIQSERPEALARRMEGVRGQVEEAVRGLVGATRE